MKTFVVVSMLLSVLICSTAVFAARGVTAQPWGKSSTGVPVLLYTLTNKHGMRATITNFGGIVTSLWAPDARGTLADVVLGYDNLAQYDKNVNNPYFGAIIGRYGNRIAKGHLVIDGKTYQLAINNPPNNLHGGPIGFDRKVWMSTSAMMPDGPAVVLTLTSRDGDMKFPGNLNVRVVYTLTDENALRIQYSAATDRDTVVNLTHHSYFNLDGAGNGTILNHRLLVRADRYTPIDATSIPLGPLASVDGTPFDFRKLTAIGARIGLKNQQLINGNGYDHNFVLDRKREGDMELAATVVAPASGRTMEMWTTQPGVQFYSGNFLNGKNIGKGGKPYQKHYGFCLEAQHYPDSPNEPAYPSTLLRPHQIYSQTTQYKFFAR